MSIRYVDLPSSPAAGAHGDLRGPRGVEFNDVVLSLSPAAKGSAVRSVRDYALLLTNSVRKALVELALSSPPEERVEGESGFEYLHWCLNYLLEYAEALQQLTVDDQETDARLAAALRYLSNVVHGADDGRFDQAKAFLNTLGKRL